VGLIPSNPMLDGSGVKAMPGSIPTPNSGSLLKKTHLIKQKDHIKKWLVVCYKCGRKLIII